MPPAAAAAEIMTELNHLTSPMMMIPTPCGSLTSCRFLFPFGVACAALRRLSLAAHPLALRVPVAAVTAAVTVVVPPAMAAATVIRAEVVVQAAAAV